MNLKLSFRTFRKNIRMLKKQCLNLIDPPVVVLIYHRVGTLPSDPHMLSVSLDNFRNQMNYLKRNYTVIRFEDDWAKVPKPAVVITFDDGYADNCLNALPILEEVEVPATIFVSSGYVGSNREFWWDDLERLVLNDNAKNDCFTLVDEQYAQSWQTSSISDRERLYSDLHLLMKQITPQRRDEWFKQIMSWSRCNEDARISHLPLSIKELIKLSASPWITIGAHTITHTPLSSLSLEQQQNEIMKSTTDLESLIGKKIQVFSYPFGTKSDFDKFSIQICRMAGFKRVAANFAGQIHTWTDKMLIPRLIVRDWPEDHFSKMIQDEIYPARIKRR